MFHGLVGATQSDLYTASLGTYKRIFMVDAQPSLLASLMKKWGVSSHICDFTKFKNQYFTKKKKLMDEGHIRNNLKGKNQQ